MKTGGPQLQRTEFSDKLLVVVEPYAQSAGASPAFERVIGTEQLAWPIELLNRDDPAEFVERWLGWFADAAEGTLARPSSMPEKPIHNRWREP